MDERAEPAKPAKNDERDENGPPSHDRHLKTGPAYRTTAPLAPEVTVTSLTVIASGSYTSASARPSVHGGSLELASYSAALPFARGAQKRRQVK
jgi:hypothetical protein